MANIFGAVVLDGADLNQQILNRLNRVAGVHRGMAVLDEDVNIDAPTQPSDNLALQDQPAGLEPIPVFLGFGPAAAWKIEIQVIGGRWEHREIKRHRMIGDFTARDRELFIESKFCQCISARYPAAQPV